MDGRLIIVGGGGFAREVFVWVTACAEAGTLPAIGGYVDDAGDVLAHKERYAMPWLGGIDDVAIGAGDRFVMAIGSPKAKRAIHARLRARGARFATVIHPSCIVAPTATIGEGVFLCPGCIIAPDSVVEPFVMMNTGSGTAHDSRVGEFTVFASSVILGGYADIGEDVSIGSHVVVLPKVRIGRGATIGPGSVLYRSVPEGATVFAPPAKQLRLK